MTTTRRSFVVGIASLLGLGAFAPKAKAGVARTHLFALGTKAYHTPDEAKDMETFCVSVADSLTELLRILPKGVVPISVRWINQPNAETNPDGKTGHFRVYAMGIPDVGSAPTSSETSQLHVKLQP